jgi:hypothetical protein
VAAAAIHIGALRNARDRRSVNNTISVSASAGARRPPGGLNTCILAVKEPRHPVLIERRSIGPNLQAIRPYAPFTRE